MANPTTIIDGEEILNSEVTRDYLCDACYGELTERYEDGEWVVRCFEDPRHHGFIKRTTGDFREREEEFRGRG